MIHDVGAGGLSNAVPEVVAPAAAARIELARVPSDEPGMSPLEIWCNEAQERYVLALEAGALDGFVALCRRERCPFAVIGAGDATTAGSSSSTTADRRARRSTCRSPTCSAGRRACTASAARRRRRGDGFDADALDPRERSTRLLRLPAIADKGFLVTIGDRSVGGHDQPRPAGRPLAGAGQRRRRHDLGPARA